SASAAFTVQESELELAKFITGPGDGSQLLKATTADTRQTITYTLMITNNGPDTLPAGSVVNDTLPTGVTLTGVGSVSGTITNTGNAVAWTLPQLLNNEVTTATITATVDAGTTNQTLTNTATINSATQGDRVTVNNVSTATLTVNGADLEIGKSVTPVLPLEGDTITYTIVITNIAGNTSTNIVISDILPTGITYGGLVSSSPSQGTYLNGSIGVWSGITLTLNSTASLVFTATVDGGTGGSTLVNSTGISSTTTEDPVSSNNNASASITVATFDLAISKSSIRDTNTVTYTVTVINNGPTTAPGAIISDTVPSGFGGTWNWSCTESNGATCPNAAGSGDIYETSGAIPTTGQLDYTITATLVISTATITNTATVTTPTGLGDSTPGNNTAVDVSSVSSGDIYLPIIMNNFSPPPSDLVITDIQFISNNLVVTVKNEGLGSVVNAFWLDVYFKPNSVPKYNQEWFKIAPAGAVWGVTKSLAPGESLVLAVDGAYYYPGKSSSSFPANAKVYGYVDSINHATSYGNVKETNESNNLFGPVTSSTISSVDVTTSQVIKQTGLPTRN
ncbi:MAG: DUF11 domain-containing protein, partial [Chloroflexi bacterium]|nr:DUF11 domain-containing protein [Chloroflexota bacterium]